MRLTPVQVQAIVATARGLAGPKAQVRLFGSRLQDDVRGGDIDLLVDVPEPVDRPIWLAALLTARLQRVLGDRRIDVLLVDPTIPVEPVHEVARRDGILLEP